RPTRTCGELPDSPDRTHRDSRPTPDDSSPPRLPTPHQHNRARPPAKPSSRPSAVTPPPPRYRPPSAWRPYSAPSSCSDSCPASPVRERTASTPPALPPEANTETSADAANRGTPTRQVGTAQTPPTDTKVGPVEGTQARG